MTRFPKEENVVTIDWLMAMRLSFARWAIVTRYSSMSTRGKLLWRTIESAVMMSWRDDPLVTDHRRASRARLAAVRCVDDSASVDTAQVQLQALVPYFRGRRRRVLQRTGGNCMPHNALTRRNLAYPTYGLRNLHSRRVCQLCTLHRVAS